jgi:transcriptional regulator with XRE-family HTH domain
MRHIGERLRELRRARGLTVTDVADLIGASHASVSRWETGRQVLPSYEALVTWVEALGGRAHLILMPDATPLPSDPAYLALVDELLTQLPRLTPARVETLRALLKTWA